MKRDKKRGAPRKKTQDLRASVSDRDSVLDTTATVLALARIEPLEEREESDDARSLKSSNIGVRS
jgi:hypothetical protein